MGVGTGPVRARARPTCKLKLNMTSYNMPRHPISSPLHSITVFSLVLNTDDTLCHLCVASSTDISQLELISTDIRSPGPTGVQTES